MPRYSVVGKVYASKFIGVFEASTPDEAIQQALDSDGACVCLCHQCAPQAEDPQIEDAEASLLHDDEE